MVWQVEQASKCLSCGTFDWEWEDNPEAWVADIHLCPGCRSLELLRDDTSKSAVHAEGYKLRLYREKEDDGI